MKVLVIGSGGREHAIAWKLAQSREVSRVYAAPGNGGTAEEDKCVNIDVPGNDPASQEAQETLLRFAQKEEIDFTVVGPEAPLAAGIVDRFRNAGLSIIGPDEKAARLEASKVFSKAFMRKYGIRTGRGKSFSDYQAAQRFVNAHFKSDNGSLVIKADGLAAGKGVVIAENAGDAASALESFMRDKTLGTAGSQVLLEECLEGREVSVLAAVSVAPGKEGFIAPFVSARDHKRRFDGGQGPNTGGMGAIAPVPDFTGAAVKDFLASVLLPTVKGMEAEAMDYRGFIFFGLMVNKNHSYLLEYNVRLGDPETQAVLPLMESDFSELCSSILNSGIKNFPLVWKEGAVCAPVAVAGGYPGPYRRGDHISVDTAALEKAGAKVFVAGAANTDAGLSTQGGRVLTVSAWGRNGDAAREKAYQGMNAVRFHDMAFRQDIGRENIV